MEVSLNLFKMNTITIDLILIKDKVIIIASLQDLRKTKYFLIPKLDDESRLEKVIIEVINFPENFRFHHHYFYYVFLTTMNNFRFHLINLISMLDCLVLVKVYSLVVS